MSYLSISELGGALLKGTIIKTEKNGERGKIKTDTAMSQSKVLPVHEILKGFELIPGRVPRTACASQYKSSGCGP